MAGPRTESEAICLSKAEDRISGLLQRPDQLERVEEFKKREIRQKAAKEAMLKTALQSQLEGIQMGLELLKETRTHLVNISQGMLQIQKITNDIPKLGVALQDIKQESFEHSQLEMAMDNMNNIFNINKNIDRVKVLINEGTLLQAHIRLSELETSRDELLFELFRVGNKSEQTMLLDYFSDVEKLSDDLKRQLVLNLKRTLNIARKEPTLLVNTLRITEREEKADELALQRYELTNFLPPGRPKKWRQMVLDILEASVTERLEASQLESRAENKMWLVRYLEVMRLLILEDLSVIKSLCVPCFPPRYNILEKYVQMYHSCLAKLLEECISNGLEGYEYVSLLSWILNTYKGPDLLSNSKLNLEQHQIPENLLSSETMQQLKKSYLATIDGKYRSWRTNALNKEVEEWWKSASPQSDNDGYFHTEAPIIIFKMVDENLQLAATVGLELVQEMLLLSLDMIRAYGQAYENEVKDFKGKYFEDRSNVQNFTQFIIAVVNNCLYFMDLAHQTKDKYWKSAIADSQAAPKFEAVLLTFENLREKAAGFLLEEALLDLEPHFQNLVTRGWLENRDAIDTICLTLEDYFQDYVHLKPKNFDLVMTQGKALVAKKYLLAVMSRKVAFKSQDERKKASEKIVMEAGQVRRLFERIGSASQGKGVPCPFSAIEAVAEVIKVEDLDILSLELHSLFRHYPDLTREQLMAILSLRGDIGRFELKPKAAEIIPTAGSNRGPVPQSIFSQVHIPASIFN